MSNSGSALQFGSPEYHDAVEEGTHPPAMFATAKEVLKTHNLEDQGDMTTKELLKGKLEEADQEPGSDPLESNYDRLADPAVRQSGWYGGLTQRIKEHGYDWNHPIEIRAHGDSSTVHQGHHRLAVMRRDRPNEFIPLEYGY